MFVAGDILKVKPGWLSAAEKADPKYSEAEYYVRDSWEGKVEVVCLADTFYRLFYLYPPYPPRLHHV